MNRADETVLYITAAIAIPQTWWSLVISFSLSGFGYTKVPAKVTRVQDGRLCEILKYL